MPTDTDIKTIIRRVTDFGRKPTTPAQVLQQAHDLLSQEGRWIKGELFQDGDPEVAYEQSSCGKWGVCSLGALGIVSGEMPVKVAKYEDWSGEFFEWAPLVDIDEYDTPLSHRAAQYLACAIDPDYDPDPNTHRWEDPAGDTVATFNDQKGVGRTKVLKVFRKAIELAKGDPIGRGRAVRA